MRQFITWFAVATTALALAARSPVRAPMLRAQS